MLSLLQAEEGADSVQVLGDCEGAGSAGKASTEAFKALQQSTQMSKVLSDASLQCQHACHSTAINLEDLTTSAKGTWPCSYVQRQCDLGCGTPHSLIDCKPFAGHLDVFIRRDRPSRAAAAGASPESSEGLRSAARHGVCCTAPCRRGVAHQTVTAGGGQEEPA